MNRIKREVKARMTGGSTSRGVVYTAKRTIDTRGDAFRTPPFSGLPEQIGVPIAALALSTQEKLQRGTREGRHERLLELRKSIRHVCAVLRAVRQGTVAHSYVLTSLLQIARRLQVADPAQASPTQTLKALNAHYLRQFKRTQAYFPVQPYALP